MTGDTNRQSPEDYFGTFSDPSGGLRRHAVRQTTLTVVGQITQAVLQLGSTIVLARLLSPSDFGLIAMVAVLVAFIHLFRDIGFTQAVVQQEELSATQATGLFWTSATVTLAFAVITGAAAPLVARFYGEADLVAVTAAFAGVLFVGGLGTMPQAILTRRMEFAKIVRAEIFSTLLGVAVAIAMASIGAGHWALVALPGTRAATMTTILWAICPWRPGSPARKTGIGAMLRFGTNVTGFNVFNYFARNADNALIGWRWGPSQLGQYSTAYRILVLPLSQLNAPLARVAVPTLARMKNDSDRYRRAYLRIVRISVSIAAPAMALAAVTSDWIVALSLGSGWEQAATVFAWLALAGIFQPLVNTTGWLFLTQDRTGELFRLGFVSSTVAVVAFTIGLPHGAVGVAASYALADVFIRTPLALIWSGRRGPVSIGDMLSVLVLPVMLAFWAALSALLIRSLASGLTPVVGLMLATTLTGAGSALMVRFTTVGRQVLEEAKLLVRDLRSSSAA